MVVGSDVSSLECEVEGVVLGFKMATHVQYFRNFNSRKLIEDVYIFCDSSIVFLLTDKPRLLLFCFSVLFLVKCLT